MAGAVRLKGDRRGDRHARQPDQAGEHEPRRVAARRLGADAELVCAMAAAEDTPGGGRMCRAERQRGGGGQPGVPEVGDVAERDPADRQPPPVPARQIDLLDHAHPPTLDRVERHAGFEGGYLPFHVMLTFHVGKWSLDFPARKVNAPTHPARSSATLVRRWPGSSPASWVPTLSRTG